MKTQTTETILVGFYQVPIAAVFEYDDKTEEWECWPADVIGESCKSLDKMDAFWIMVSKNKKELNLEEWDL